MLATAVQRFESPGFTGALTILHLFPTIQRTLRCRFLITLHFVVLLITKDMKKVSASQIKYVTFICKACMSVSPEFLTVGIPSPAYPVSESNTLSEPLMLRLLSSFPISTLFLVIGVSRMEYYLFFQMRNVDHCLLPSECYEQ